MRAFTSMTAVAAPVPIENIDTDMLVPARFLKTISRHGLGRALFASQRFASDGQDTDFVLNRAPWRSAGILVGLDNFGCGSSREHAPWALLDFGIRCIIAPSFAEIFFLNCFKNGILPVTLDVKQVSLLLDQIADPDAATLTVDLRAQTIVTARRDVLTFTVDPQRRERLLNGIDDITQSLGFDADIASHERNVVECQPWMRSIKR
jgi:3-isopropylmalate/(R)-2-methylmalate dehydratase small subunit